MFPVPRDRVQDVIDLLARRRSVRPAETSFAGLDAWDAASLRTMWAESTPQQQRFLGHLARSENHAATTQEVADIAQLERGPASVPGFLGALARRCRNRYGRSLPFENQWNDRDGSLYVMPSRIADIVKPFLDQSGELPWLDGHQR
jgi:hypothetical protein